MLGLSPMCQLIVSDLPIETEGLSRDLRTAGKSFEGEGPVDSSETGIEGTEGTSWGAGGPRYEGRREET